MSSAFLSLVAGFKEAVIIAKDYQTLILAEELKLDSGYFTAITCSGFSKESCSRDSFKKKESTIIT